MTNVYIFDFGNRIKIGKSNRVQQRLKAIENQSGEKAKQIFSVETDSTKEMILQKYLHEYRTVGEYFNCSFELAKSAFQNILDGKIKLERKITEKIQKENMKKNVKRKIPNAQLINNKIVRTTPASGKSSVADKVKALLNIKGKKIYELAEYFNISAQAMSNKFNRDSFSAEDLIKIADFLNCKLAILIDDDQKTILDINDIIAKAGE